MLKMSVFACVRVGLVYLLVAYATLPFTFPFSPFLYPGLCQIPFQWLYLLSLTLSLSLYPHSFHSSIYYYLSFQDSAYHLSISQEPSADRVNLQSVKPSSIGKLSIRNPLHPPFASYEISFVRIGPDSLNLHLRHCREGYPITYPENRSSPSRFPRGRAYSSKFIGIRR